MKAMPERHIHIEPKHYFAPGLYLREISIPKGVTLTGKIHKTEHLCILSKGEVSVRTDDGIKRIKASTVVHSSPGMKRVLYAHEDSVWINCHHNPSNESDLEKIENHYVSETYQDYYLCSARTLDDVVKALGTTHERLKEISERVDDQIPFPSDQDAVEIKQSDIHGFGVFATRNLQKGERISLARIGDKRTPAGRYCNHSGTPNAEMVMSDECVYLVALQDIEANQEILSDYYMNYANTRPLIAGGE